MEQQPRPELVPNPAVRRLSLYLRQLEAFKRKDRRTISSKQLGESLNLTDAQVRKDLAYFGQFGHPGIGYRVDDLIAQVPPLKRLLPRHAIQNIVSGVPFDTADALPPELIPVAIAAALLCQNPAGATTRSLLRRTSSWVFRRMRSAASATSRVSHRRDMPSRRR